MIKWVKLTKTQYFGFFSLGLALLLLQELPYIVMPFIPLASNPLMEMQDKSLVLNVIEKVLGISSIASMMFIVHKDANCLSLNTPKEKRFFCGVMLAIASYFIGWVLYFNGIQNLVVILCLLVAMPPIYYTFIGFWRKNYVLVVLGTLFLFAHIANVSNNLVF